MRRRPTFLRTAEQLDKWLERFNPLRNLTLGALGGYFDEADEGRFSNVMWLARKMIRRDAVIRACMKRLNGAMQRLEWRVKVMETLPAGVSEAQAEAQRVALLARYEGIENLKAAACWTGLADFYGFAHLERHYNAAGRVTRLQPVPQWHWVREGIYGAWKYNPTARPLPTDAVDIEPGHFVIREVDDPWLEIALINGYDRNQLRRDLRGFIARYGIPSTFFIAPPDATDEDMGSYNAMAADLAADGTGVLPHGSQVETHGEELKGDIFRAADEAFQSEIVMAATGGLLTMLSQSGSGTLAGGAHSASWLEIVEGVAAEVSECFQEQLDKTWLAEVFPGQPVAAYFEFAAPDEQADNAATAETVSKLVTAGYRPKAEWLEEETGIPLELPEPPPAPPVPPVRNRARVMRKKGEVKRDAAARRLAEAMAADAAPAVVWLERIMTATDAEMPELMAEIEAAFPSLAREVFEGTAAEALLRDVAALELVKGAAGG